jgi:hypothetical protein
MHALVFHQVTHRIISSHGQSVLLAIEAVDQVKKHFGFEIRHLQLVDVVPEEVIRRGAIVFPIQHSVDVYVIRNKPVEARPPSAPTLPAKKGVC